MTIYAQFDPKGLPTAFYDTQVHAPEVVPADAVEITEAQWREFIDNQGARRWNGRDVEVYTPPGPTEAELFKRLRDERNSLLEQTDWVVLRSQETGKPIPQEWKDYRQALRDLPTKVSDIKNVVWPTPPGK